MQSPIALNQSQSNYTGDISLVYERYTNLDNVMLTFKDNVLQIGDKVSLLGGTNNKGYVVLDYSGFYYKYDLQYIYVHVPSDHTIDGYNTEVEVQFYHLKDFTYSPSLNDYKKSPDMNHYLIISVLYAVNGTASDSGFLDSLKNYYVQGEVSANNFGTTLDIFGTGLIKDKKFYLYRGSDHVSPCSETHLHYVVAETYAVDQTTVTFLNNKYSTKYSSFTSKPLSPLYGRSVLRNFYANETEVPTE
jgi:carbonic anhydrase